MGTRLRNEAQVRRYLLSQDKIVEVVNYILDKIYETNVDVVDKVVYAAYDPSVYQRTYEFRDSWGTDGAKTSGIHVKGKFEYLPDNMIYNPDLAQHGSPADYDGPKAGDARKYLAEIIYEGLSGYLFGGGAWTKKRDAWDVLLKELDGDKIAKWAEQGFRQAGLSVKFNSSVGMDVK